MFDRILEKVEAVQSELKELIVQSEEDAEGPHCRADRLLCELLEELGYVEIVELYEDVRKWYA